MNKIGVVLANGIIEDYPRIRRRLDNFSVDYVIAADGGSLAAPELGLKPSLIVGDMDSMSSGKNPQANSIELLRYPPEKDQTDLELALRVAVGRETKHLVVLGATGGRLDMTIGNVTLLAHPALREHKIELWHGHQTAWLIRPPGEEIKGQAGDSLSLIPLYGDASGITLTDMAYPLQEGTLKFGHLRGVSNALNSKSAKVSLKRGILLAVHAPGLR
jgi:thiamine pyrophosphokinase